MEWTRLETGDWVYFKVRLDISLQVLKQTTRSGSQDGKHLGPHSNSLSDVYVVYTVSRMHLRKSVPQKFI
jgi:hypothetical protein